MTVIIRKLHRFTAADQLAFGSAGYVSAHSYEVTELVTSEVITFRLQRCQLATPYVKSWLASPAELAQYAQLLAQGQSWGAFEQDLLVGVLIAEQRAWNSSCWIEYLEVAAAYRSQGIGRQLLAALSQQACCLNTRLLMLETQHTNGAAIDFYRHCGFEITGLHTTLYGVPHGEERAVFMSKRLP